jgi:hypothetical protein
MFKSVSRIEVGRRNYTPYDLRLCKYYKQHNKSYVEDECQFVVKYNFYKALKNKYIGQVKAYNNMKFIHVMEKTNETNIRELSCYLYNATQLRECYLLKLATTWKLTLYITLQNT